MRFSKFGCAAAVALFAGLVPAIATPAATAAGVAGPFTSSTTFATPVFNPPDGFDRTLTRDAFASPAVGDVDGDGQPDVVAGFIDGHLRAWHTNGEQFLDFSTGPGAIEGSPVLADLTGDGVLDIVVTNLDGDVWGLDGHGHAFFHKQDIGVPHRHGIFGSAAVANLDRDGSPEIIAASFDEHLYAWHM